MSLVFARWRKWARPNPPFVRGRGVCDQTLLVSRLLHTSFQGRPPQAQKNERGRRRDRADQRNAETSGEGRSRLLSRARRHAIHRVPARLSFSRRRSAARARPACRKQGCERLALERRIWSAALFHPERLSDHHASLARRSSLWPHCPSRVLDQANPANLATLLPHCLDRFLRLVTGGNDIPVSGLSENDQNTSSSVSSFPWQLVDGLDRADPQRRAQRSLERLCRGAVLPDRAPADRAAVSLEFDPY